MTVVDATADSRAGAGGTGKSESHPNGPPQQYFFNHATSPSTRVRNKRVLQFVCERTSYVALPAELLLLTRIEKYPTGA